MSRFSERIEGPTSDDLERGSGRVIEANVQGSRHRSTETAARRRARSAIRDEVGRLAADDADREEMRVIREQMAELAPPPD